MNEAQLEKRCLDKVKLADTFEPYDQTLLRIERVEQANIRKTTKKLPRKLKSPRKLPRKLPPNSRLFWRSYKTIPKRRGGILPKRWETLVRMA